MKIKIANAPCSWGVLEFELEGKAAGYAQVLDEISEAGYTGTELGDWGFMPTDPAQLKKDSPQGRLYFDRPGDLLGALRSNLPFLPRYRSLPLWRW